MRRSLSALALLALLTAPAAAGETITQHAMSPRAAQVFFDEMVAKGWRYRNVDTVATPEGVRYAMTFSNEKQPRFLARSGLSADSLQSVMNDAAKDGFRPVALSVADMGAGQFAVILEKNDGRVWHERHGLTLDGFQSVLKEQMKAGRKLSDIDCFDRDGDTRFAALFEAKGGTVWEAWVNLGTTAWQAKLEDMMAKGFRPTRVNACASPDGPQFAAIFEKSDGRIWRARHNLTPEQYQTEFDENAAKGLTLVDISAYQSNGETLYAAIWAK